MCLSNTIVADTIVCPISSDKLRVNESINYYIDTTFDRSIEDIIKNKTTLFKPFYNKIVNSRKRQSGNIWGNFQIKNTTNKTLIYHLKIEDPYINRLHLYTFQKDTFQLDKSGINYPFHTRKITYRNHISIIEIAPQTTVELYMMADKYGKAVRLNVELWKPEKLLARLSENNLVTGVFYGILFLLIILTIIAYAQFRAPFIIGYALYLFSGVLYGLANSGLLFQYFMDGFPPMLLELIRPWCLFIGYSGLVFFVNRLFNQPIVFKRLNIACRWFHYLYIALFIVGSIFYFIIPKTAWIWFITLFSTSAALIGVLGIIISFTIVLKAYKKDKSIEAATLVVVYFLLFFYSVFITTNVFFLQIHNLPLIFVENVSLIFLLLETILMSFVISVSIQTMIENKEMLKIEVERQKLELAQSIIQGAENERERIAKELHDSIGSYLSTIGIYADQLHQKDDLKSKIRTLVDNTHDEIRRISDDLLPMAFNRFGLIEAIKNLCDDLDSKNIEVRFITNIKHLKFTNFQQLNIYRIVQELTNNTIKHAAATKLTVQFLKDEEGFVLTVEDNGKGFDLEQVKANKITAFHSLQSRCQSLNAQLHIEPSQQGTIVIIEIEV